MSGNPELTASRKRAAHPDFVPTFSLTAVQERLPLRFPVPPGLLPSPKCHYRSQYRYLGYADLADPNRRQPVPCSPATKLASVRQPQPSSRRRQTHRKRETGSKGTWPLALGA